MIRWNLLIPDETDRAVRAFLAHNGGRKGDHSKFVDAAVRRSVLELTVRQVKERNAEFDQQALLDMIDQEVSVVRTGCS